MAKSIIQQARTEFAYRPRLKEIETQINQALDKLGTVEQEELQQILFVRDIYVRLHQSGLTVKQIDLAMGRICNDGEKKLKDKLNQFNWNYLSPVLDSYSVAECKVIDAQNESGSFLRPADIVFTEIQRSLEQKQGFSFVRLGDGEGTLLKSDLDNSVDTDLIEMLELWWGRKDFSPKALKQAQNDLMTALNSADIIGIPDFHHQLSDFRINDSRASRSYRYPNQYVTEHPYELYVAAYSNHHLFTNGILNKLIQHSEVKIGVVTGHKQALIEPYFIENYEKQIEHYYLVPSEHKFSEKFKYENTDDHFPGKYKHICASIQGKDFHQTLFLVGAGVLGKYYCHLIKQQGGIALDIGSVFDYMLGHKTRKFF